MNHKDVLEVSEPPKSERERRRWRLKTRSSQDGNLGSPKKNFSKRTPRKRRRKVVKVKVMLIIKVKQKKKTKKKKKKQRASVIMI